MCFLINKALAASAFEPCFINRFIFTVVVAHETWKRVNIFIMNNHNLDCYYNNAFSQNRKFVHKKVIEQRFELVPHKNIINFMI